MPNDFIPLAEAARRLGVSEFTVRRRIASGELPAWSNPRDKRSRLVRVADLDAYAVPRRIAPRHGQETLVPA